MVMEDDELLDLVDENDKVIGTIYRSEFYRLESENLGYIRACELFIQNDEGKLWIPKRTASKRIAPNGLDYSCGGHVGSGQTYMEAMLREIREELGLRLTPDDLRFIIKFRPRPKLPYFRNFYVYRSNTAPSYNPDDFVGAAWMTVEELAEKLQSGVPAKSSLLESVAVLTGKP